MKIVFILPIFLLASFLIFFYLVLPGYQNKSRLQEEIAEKTQELAKTEEDIIAFSQAGSKLKDYGEAIAKIENALPPAFSFADFLNYLQKEVSDNGLILLSFGQEKGGAAPSQEGQAKEPKEHLVSFSTSGSWQAMESLISALEKSSRLIAVESRGSGEDRGELQLSLHLKVQY